MGQLTILSQTPDDACIKKAQAVIVEKDAVILAEAKQSKADIVATLDKKHFFTKPVMDFVNPQKIMTPKMIFKKPLR